MKRTIKFLLFISVLAVSCKSDLDMAKAEKNSENKKVESTSQQQLYKELTITVFENENLIGSCAYFISLTQTTVSNTPIWIVSDIDEGISKIGGYYLYKSPTKVIYTKTKSGYDITLQLECQVATTEATLKNLGIEGISFVKTYDDLTDNELSVIKKDMITFNGYGTICTKGDHIRASKTVVIRQEETQLKIEQKELKILPSDGFTAAKHYDFLTSNDFPETIKFEKSIGNKPIFESKPNSENIQIERVSKYDSTGVIH